MIQQEEIEGMKPFEARKIIEALRKGSVPIEYVLYFTVGREKWLSIIQDDLENYIAEGGAKVRFLSGDYGDGKTHFMSILQHLSLQEGFATSFLVLSRELPIHKFELVYQALVQQLLGKFEGVGIKAMLAHWLDSLAEDFKGKKEKREDKINELGEAIRNFPEINSTFASGLIAVMKNRYLPLSEGEKKADRQTEYEILIHWFEGKKLTKKELKPFGIFEVLNKTNSKSMLNSLNQFLRYLGHKGLILLIDELETVLAQSASIRNASYENLRLLIDNTELGSHLHLFFSIIPDVLLSEKGFKSYDALWSRVRAIGEQKRLNYRGVLIDLHRTPLEMEELVDLGSRLRSIYEISYRWEAGDSLPDKFLEDICEQQKKMGLLNETRLYIKQLIRLYDLAEQGNLKEELNLAEHIVSSQKEVEQDKVEGLQSDWDS